MNIQILETISDAFFVLDGAWRFISLNSAAETLLGKTKRELLNQCIWEVFPELLETTFEQEYRQVVRSHEGTHFEAFFPVGRRWVEVQLAPYLDGISVCLRDTTERRQVEAMLFERSRLATLEAEIGRALVHAHSIKESLTVSSEVLVEQLNTAGAAIWSYNSQIETLELQAVTLHPDADPSLAQNELLTVTYLPTSNSILGSLALSRQPIHDLVFAPFGEISPKTAPLNLEVKPDPLFCQMDGRRNNTKAKLHLVGYPLVVEDRLVGVIALWCYQALDKITHEAIATIADHLAIAIDRCWARQALLSRREALLFRLANQIRNSLDLDTILGTAVQEIRHLLQVDWCSYLWCWSQGNQLSLTVSHEARGTNKPASAIANCPPEKLLWLAQQIESLNLLRIDDIHQPFLLGEETTQSADFLELLQSFHIQSILLIPLKTRSNHLGAIACMNDLGSRHWSEPDIELLQAVVDQLALAIDQAELFAQTRAAALAAQTQAQQLELTIQELKRTQSQLIQTEKMSSLGQMIAGIAHEINNPVNFISGNLSYTSEYVEDLLKLVSLYQETYPQPNETIEELADEIDLEFIIEDLPKTLASMQIGAERIRQIVLSLRNFSRLDQADMKPVDIHEGIDSTLLILHNRLKAKGEKAEIQVIKKYGKLPQVECYAGQLNQVFMNILSNSIDALENSPEPHCITISTEVIPDSQHPHSDRQTGLTYGDVLIRITDNGVGMSPETVHHIFDPFFTTKPVGKGTGLGLAISYQIVVEKHHGKIECISKPNEGTQFVIQIPIQPPPSHRKS
ncbi:GAF domain-containing protein [Spirulina subsalsa FACHB-351]|uniref:histidine kinase n=1 Tax=Spirulina subsalsa FACHB-351 TaxID=234711 RepID=A0ABT3L6U8_9CYAN|nr:ATP-binding protein [Spirulina subsalsa]MCW6037219.1 GAF domain-containing protein [Spirulina subsalsa FACHB-351]